MKKVWSTAVADKKFSIYIRDRDKKCARCGKTENLQNSHFWSRNHSSTRYIPENCIALCAGCHIFHWEIEKQGAYRDYMINWLGEEKYKWLDKLAHSTVSRRNAIIQLMELLST